MFPLLSQVTVHEFQLEIVKQPCAPGAYHRQLATKASTPLNLPSGLSDNILDGLFTSGLRFIRCAHQTLPASPWPRA